MGFFRRKKEAEEASVIAVMATAFGQALAGVLTAQSAQIEQSSKFLGQLQDLSARKAAQIMGSKGGQTTQRRKKAAKAAAAAAQECVLCANPMHRGTTLQQIELHRQHEQSPQLSALESQPEQGQ